MDLKLIKVQFKRLLFLILPAVALPVFASNANEDLYNAVIRNDKIAVKAALTLGGDPNFHKYGQKSLLMESAYRGFVDVGTMLIDAGANVNDIDHENHTALMYSVGMNERDKPSIAFTKLLIAKGADVNLKDRRGTAAIHFAAAYADQFTLHDLIIAGADVQAYGKLDDYWSPDLLYKIWGYPIYLAAANGRTENVRELIAANADLEVPSHKLDLFAGTPLLIAIKFGYKEIVSLLLNAGADPTTDYKWINALRLAADQNSLDITKLLLQKGAPIFQKNTLGDPLYSAAAHGNLQILKELAAHGGNLMISYEGDRLTHALSQATINVSEMLEYLLKNGVPLDTDDAQLTPLGRACSNRNQVAVDAFINAGADVNKYYPNGNPVIFDAIASQVPQILISFIKAKANLEIVDKRNQMTPIIRASLTSIEMLRLFIQAGAIIDKLDRNNVSALINASRRGEIEMIRAILESGADINFRGKGNWTALHAATYENHYQIIQLLIQKGHDLNIVSNSWDDSTALIIAARYGHFDSLQRLVAAGADLYTRDGHGLMAIDYSYQRGDLRAVQVMCDAGMTNNLCKGM